MNKQHNQAARYLDTKRTPNTIGKTYIIAALIGFAVFLICALALSFLGSLAIIKNPDPSKLIPYVSTISMTVASILGSLVTAKIVSGRAGVSSLVFLAAVLLAVLVMSVINMKSHTTPFWISLLLKLPVILGGFFGGYIGSYRKKSKSPYAKYK